MKLKGKVVLITGASRGLGRALAIRLAKEGVKLALLARTKKDLESTRKLVTKLGADCEVFVCDVSDEKQVKRAIKKVVGSFKKIDVLINNAGIWYEGPTEKHSEKTIKRLYEVNIIGLTYVTKSIIPFMKKQKSGQILNISSTSGIEPSGKWGVYVGTKHAVRGYTDSLKDELGGTGIKVHAFYPGGMDTHLFTDSGFPKKGESWMMKTQDIAEIISFILSCPDDVVMDHVEVRKFFK
jgi:3-oxoacyl-[acyl-carrier protein] reductase